MIYKYEKLIQILMADKSWHGDASPLEAFGINFIDTPEVSAYNIEYETADGSSIILSFNERDQVIAIEFA